jgi:hypothetical protein
MATLQCRRRGRNKWGSRADGILSGVMWRSRVGLVGLLFLHDDVFFHDTFGIS